MLKNILFAIKAKGVALEMKWNVVKANCMNKDLVPTFSGIYCFMQSKCIEGLKTNTTPIYVGQSKNIRSRFIQHINFDKCHNHKLLVELITQSKSSPIEFHFIQVPQHKLDEIEKDLIVKLNPKFNVLMKGRQYV